MVNVVVRAHCPVSGVKVYVVVCVLSKAGDHIPVIPLSEIIGNDDITPFGQMGATSLNVGTTFVGNTWIVNVVDPTQPPDVGVKV